MTPQPTTPAGRAAKTAQWATTMTKWAIRHATGGKRKGAAAVKRWQLVEFPGPNGAESRGVVDLVAIRRDHRTTNGVLCIGDLFEIVLIQIKGGSAAWPKPDDLQRLRAVQDHYRAKAVVLAAWKKGAEPAFYVLRNPSARGKDAWVKRSAIQVFGCDADPVEVARSEERRRGCIYCGADHETVAPCAQFEAARKRFIWSEGDVTFSHEAPVKAQT